MGVLGVYVCVCACVCASAYLYAQLGRAFRVVSDAADAVIMVAVAIGDVHLSARVLVNTFDLHRGTRSRRFTLRFNDAERHCLVFCNQQTPSLASAPPTSQSGVFSW